MDEIKETKFKIKQVLAMIERELKYNPNSSELMYYMGLEEELKEKLEILKG